MTTMKTVFQWAVLALVLLFVPEQNRLVVFDSEPGDRYGEFYLTTPGRSIIIAKNSQGEAVEWRIGQSYESVSVQGRRSQLLAVRSQISAPPYSVSVLDVSSIGENEIRSRVVHSDSGSFFHPGPLTLLTRFDLVNLYFLGSILAGGLLGLGFWLAQLHDAGAASMPRE